MLENPEEEHLWVGNDDVHWEKRLNLETWKFQCVLAMQNGLHTPHHIGDQPLEGRSVLGFKQCFNMQRCGILSART
jgi:hypothetical protein